jgi:hypothetical protein
MGGINTLVAGAVSGLVGLVLMVFETIRVLNGSALNGLNNALLFVGLALLALGGGLLVLAVLSDSASGDGRTPEDDSTTADGIASVDETVA